MSATAQHISFEKDALAAWHTYLTDAPASSFPSIGSSTNRPSSAALLRRKISLPRRNTSAFTATTILRAAWSLVNVFYTDCDDVIFGIAIPAASDDANDTETTPRTAVPSRFRLDPLQTVHALMDRIQNDSMPLISSEQFSLSAIAALGSDAKSACAFNNQLIIYPNALESMSIELDRAMNLECTLTRQGANVQALFDPSLVEKLQMERILASFESVVLQLCNVCPTTSIKELNTISASDMQELSRWNKDLPEMVVECMHNLFSRKVQQAPDAPAVCSFDGDFTYATLDNMTGRLANLLSSKGVGPGTLVPFMFEKSSWTIVAMLATLKAGGAFAPLDPGHVWEDTANILESCQAKLVLCSPKNASRFRERQINHVVVERSLIDSLPDAAYCDEAVRPEDPGYIIFTSGSTGKPKGIVCSHQAWCTNALAHGPTEVLDAQSRCMQFAAYTFDVSISDIFTTLAFGGCICVPSDAERMNDLAGAMNRMRANHVVLTPTVTQFLQPEKVPHLDVLTVGGEPLTKEIVETWAGRVRLGNSYGPAECTSRTNYALVKEGDDPAIIGPALGCALWVTQSNNPHRLVPIGAVGELIIEGPILADGYLRDEEKTRAAFIDSPEWLRSAFPGRSTKVYRTGDLVQFTSDGQPRFLGRRDTQVKFHGVRLECGHIETKVKAQLPPGGQAVVDKATVGGQSQKQMLAAFVCLPEWADAGSAHLVSPSDKLKDFIVSLQQRIAETMPSHMRPNLILPINRIPQGGTAKTNRKALQALARGISDAQLNEYTGARECGVPSCAALSGMEATLRDLWAKVLLSDPETISAQDTFFRLGGDSVSAMKLVATAREAAMTLTVSDIFQFPKLADLARHVESLEDAETQATTVEPFALIGGPSEYRLLRDRISAEYKIPGRRIEDVVPCTPLQEAFMAESMVLQDAYILQEVINLPHHINVEQLKWAWEEVISEYSILRTRIVLLGKLGTCQLQLDESEPVVWQSANDLSSYLRLDKQSPMSYGDSLSRLAIVNQTDGSRYLVWTCHHAITDGWMHSLVLEQVERAYNDKPLSSTLTPFNTFVKYLSEPRMKSPEAYWASQFAGLETTQFPDWSPSYQPIVSQYVDRRVVLPKENFEFTTSILLRAAWALLLAQYTNTNDVVLGVTQSGRDVPVTGIEQCLGPTLTTVPVRVSIDYTEPCGLYVRRLQQQQTYMIPYQHTGLQHIKKISAECAAACDLHSLLVVQPFAAPSTLLPPDEASSTGSEQLRFGIALECNMGVDDVLLHCGFDAQVIEPARVHRMLAQFETIFHQLRRSGGAELPVGRVQTASAEDIHDLEAWNPEPEPMEDCMHWMVERQVRERPDAVAVDAWDGKFTYREVNDYADRLAGQLMRLGVRPETIVPFLFEKSAWTVVALLATLKAGGACVALDISHPRSRHQKIVADTEARVVLASKAQAAQFDLVPHVVAVHSDAIDALPTHSSRSAVTPRNAAFIVYSSGSTGTPKGSILEHVSLCSTSRTNANLLNFGPTTRVIQFASYAFDVAIEENVISLMYGATVCIPSDSQRLDDLAGAMRTFAVNWADLTPTVARMLSPQSVPSLRTLVMGGEALAQDVIDVWAGKVDLINTYGPSECSIQCTASTRALDAAANGANIGHPSNCKLWVVDAEDFHRLMPVGAVGELLIEGQIVGRGYLKEPAKTAAAFVEDVTWAKSKNGEKRRFYRTGDLARFNEDGTLDCLGRRDTQIKLHGQRIELGEIEYALKMQSMAPETTQVLVEAFTPRPTPDRKLLVAFVQSSESKSTELVVKEMNETIRQYMAELKSKAGQVLPEYMVPSLFVPMASLPTNTSGKTDRKQLRAMAESLDQRQLSIYSLSDAADTKVEVSTDAERVLRELWAEVLRVDLERDPIGANDSFLQLGGDSIAAMQLVGKARQAGLELSVPLIFKAPKLADMAAAAKKDESKMPAVESSQKTVPSMGEIPQMLQPYRPFKMITEKVSVKDLMKGLSEVYDIERDAVQDAYPCTPLQAGLMALTTEDSAAYVLQDVFELPQNIDIEQFKAAWAAVVREKEILRTRIAFINGVGACQIVLDERIRWQRADNLDLYLAKDRSESMGFGKPLSRYAIVDDGSRKHFIWTVHHALYDGYSYGLTLEEVQSAYENDLIVSRGPAFVDFIRYLHGTDQGACEDYWRKQLADVETLAFPQVPAGHQPQPDNTVSHLVRMEKPKGSSITTSSLLRAAWALLVAAYSGSEDVVFGVTQSGRDAPLEKIEAINGPTITTMPVRIQVKPEEQIGSFLQRVQDQAMDMIPFSHAGLQKIKKLSDSAQAACNSQSLLVIQPASADLNASPVFGTQKENTSASFLKSFGLVVECNLSDNSSELELCATHDSAVISAVQTRRLLQQLEYILTQLCNKQGSVDSIDMISTADKAQLEVWNSSYPDVVTKCIHHVIEQQSAQHPNAPAIASRDGTFTYADLERLSNGLARKLKQQAPSLGPDSFVPICLEKSPAAIVAMLAILKAGCAFVPMDPKNPVERLQDLVSQTSARCIIFSEQTAHLADKIAEFGKTAALVLPRSLRDISDSSDAPLSSAARPSNAAYALFTSGSTGRPKAVVIDHGAVSSSTAGHGEACGFTLWPRRVLQFASYTFDACITEILTTLTHGGCVCVPSEAERMNDLPRFINDFKVDWALFTPSFAALLRPEQLPTLKTLVLGGEALRQENVNVWGDRVRLMNAYGPTEACVMCVARVVPGPSQRARHEAAVIGHAVSSLAWVVSPKNHDHLAPVGAVGELLVQGPSLARGYLNEPEKTAAAFVENPKWLKEFGYGEPQRLYKTGDLVRYNFDGTLTYLGRKDDQVKVNGQRLELGEIETQLKAKCSTLSQAIVVVGKPKNQDSKQTLAAFLQFEDAQAASDEIFLPLSDALRQRLEELESSAMMTLANYMVPALWVPLGRMPTQVSGKTDRKALVGLLRDMSTENLAKYSLSKPSNNEIRAPATTMERKIHGLVAKVLAKDMNSFGTDESFFRIGGDSITAIQLVSSARADGIILSTEDIFRQPAIAEMAKAAKFADAAAVEDDAAAPYSLLPEGKKQEIMEAIIGDYDIPESTVEDVLPCTPLQEGLIALTIKDSEAYVVRDVFRLPMSLDIERFKAAWEMVARDAAILRTRIVSLETSGCYQVVLQEGIKWRTGSKVKEYIEDDKLHPFRYGLPLVRFAIIDSSWDGRYFVWTMHHSLYDGWSYGLMLNRVREAYEKRSIAPTPPFNRFIKYLEATDRAEAKKFWTEQFFALEARQFPRLPSPTHETLIDQTIDITIPVTRKADSGFTLATILKAAWALILARYTGSADALFGVTNTGRNASLAGVADTVGPTIATVPVRIKVDNDTPVRSFLEAVQKQTVDMIRYEHTGLQYIARMGAECREACNFTNILVIQPGDQTDIDFLGTQRLRDEEKAMLRFGLGLECTLQGNSVSVTGGFDSRLIAPVQMQRMLHQFRAAVEQLNLELPQNVGNIMLFSAEDAAEMAEWNRVMPPAVDECAHHVIRRTVARAPDALAVNAWDIDMRYWELDNFSTKLAHHLRSLGVGPETIVPLCFEKSGWSVVALLAVMKAGGAFVFLDPGYPISRLQEIVNQTGAKLVLTSLAQAGLWKSRLRVQIVDEVSIESLPSFSAMPETGVTPQNALYCIFTSGSTGKPKGCIVEHANFLTGAKAQAERASMMADSRVLQVASYSFDVSILEMVTAMTVGACICVPHERAKSRSIAAVINDYRITWAFLTPSVVKLIKPAEVPGLKTLILGGEALTTQNVETWAEHVQLANGYGPSECSIAAAGHPNLLPGTDPANIGKAVGCVCWITEPNDHNRLAPVGTIGEILIEGPIVARGYLNNPEKTAEVFIENPAWADRAADQPPRRLYKTGDLAYFNPDGSINFVGRKDTQVKVRGQRMELGEIETHLSLNQQVEHAMVLYPKGGLCKQKLVAILSLKDLGASTNSSETVELIDTSANAAASSAVTEISGKLSTILPSYMVPNLWIVAKSFPLLLSGKLNRKRVEQWILDMDDQTHRRICGMADAADAAEAPSTVVEQQLQRIWADVLRLPIQDIGVKQAFTSLGGDSILAMQVVAQARKKGIHINLVDIFSARTIYHLSQRAKTDSAGDAALEPPVAEEEKLNEPFELTPIQQFYAGVALGPDFVSRETNKRFNHTFALRIRRNVAASDLSRALEALVQRHSMLRARFVRPQNRKEKWTQLISDKVAESFQFRAWDDCTLEQVQPAMEEARTGLDIERGPLIAADLVTTTDNEQHFFIVAHHLVVDMVSWTVILRDLESLVTNGTFSNDDKPFPYQTWARLQAEHASANLPPTTALPIANDLLPADFAYWGMQDRPNVVRDSVSTSITLPASATTALIQTCNASYGAEPMDVLTSTLSHAFSYVFRDRQTPTVFRYSHGREPWSPRIDPARTVGWFTTLSPARVDLSSRREDSITVLQRAVAQRRRVPANGWAYFASRYHHPAGAAAFRGHEEMEVTINYLGAHQSGMSEASLFDVPEDQESAGFGAQGQDVKCFSLVSVTASVDVEGRLGVKCQWNRHMRRQEDVERWFRVFERLLLDVAKRAVPRAQRLAAEEEMKKKELVRSEDVRVVAAKRRSVTVQPCQRARSRRRV